MCPGAQRSWFLINSEMKLLFLVAQWQFTISIVVNQGEKPSQQQTKPTSCAPHPDNRKPIFNVSSKEGDYVSSLKCYIFRRMQFQETLAQSGNLSSVRYLGATTMSLFQWPAILNPPHWQKAKSSTQLTKYYSAFGVPVSPCCPWKPRRNISSVEYPFLTLIRQGSALLTFCCLFVFNTIFIHVSMHQQLLYQELNEINSKGCVNYSIDPLYFQVLFLYLSLWHLKDRLCCLTYFDICHSSLGYRIIVISCNFHTTWHPVHHIFGMTSFY